ncbi:MAG: tetratricopeptide repeat protein [Planctomycetes bacterium]|nr:tetratricopeptide repeat protein [Planctomycetota bacterium]
MDARQLYESGKLSEAISALNAEVKSNPGDLGLRTFLFELLCFNGEWDRAVKQLDVIGQQDVQLDPVAQSYRNLVSAEQSRGRFFSEGLKPDFLFDPPPDYVHTHLEAGNRLRENNDSQAKSLLDEAEENRREISGTLDGTPFKDFRDCDDLLAPILELFVVDRYIWLPFEQIATLEISAPQKPRDLLWSSCDITLSDGSPCHGFIPVLYWGSCEQDDEQIRLGRMTDWNTLDNGPILGLGQRAFLTDETDRAMLEVRNVSFHA